MQELVSRMGGPQIKMARVNDQILDRLERVIETLQDNSVKMGQMLAVHDEKLDKQDRIDAVLFEKVESLHRAVSYTHLTLPTKRIV